MRWFSTSSSVQQPPSGGRGSLYPACQRLLKAKLVRAEWTISSSTNRRVRVYQITKAGVHRLEREFSSFEPHARRHPDGARAGQTHREFLGDDPP